jgi:hypothetical protein
VLLALLGLLVLPNAYGSLSCTRRLLSWFSPCRWSWWSPACGALAGETSSTGSCGHPFRRELRPYLLQCVNHWLFWALFGATLLAGTFAVVPAQLGWLLSRSLPDWIPYRPLLIVLDVRAVMMAPLAVVPRRPVQVPPTSWSPSAPCSRHSAIGDSHPGQLTMAALKGGPGRTPPALLLSVCGPPVAMPSRGRD